MTNAVFIRRDGGEKWPRTSDGLRMLKVRRINDTKWNRGRCSCSCKEIAFVEIHLFDAKVGLSGGTTKIFACRKHASLFLEHTHVEADRKVKAWDNGWEVSCDFCGADCAEKPRIYIYVPTCKGASMAGRFASTLCKACKQMEELFA